MLVLLGISTSIVVAVKWGGESSVDQQDKQLSILVILQIQLERLLHWNMAVRDFHILINLVKVSSHLKSLSSFLKS